MIAPRTSAFTVARLPVGPNRLSVRGLPGCRCFPVPPCGSVFPREGVAFLSWTVCSGFLLALAVIPSFSGLPVKVGFLPGVTLRLLLRLWQAFTRAGECFSRVRGGSPPVHLVGQWSLPDPDRGCSFFKAVRSSLILTSSTGRQGWLRRWLSLPQGKEPSQAPPPKLGGLVSSPVYPTPVYRAQGGGADARIQVSSTLCPFQNSRPFRPCSRGRLAFPSCYLSNMVTAVLEDFEVFRSLRNT